MREWRMLLPRRSIEEQASEAEAAEALPFATAAAATELSEPPAAEAAAAAAALFSSPAIARSSCSRTSSSSGVHLTPPTRQLRSYCDCASRWWMMS